MAELSPLRPGDLAAIGLVGLGAGWALATSAYGALPAIPIAAGAPFLLLALIEIGAGVLVRRRIEQGRIGVDGRGLHPLTVARLLVLARASSITGALLAGLWAGLLIELSSAAGRVQAASDDLSGTVLALIAAAVLVGAAVWLERGCRTPPQPPEAEPG